MFFIDTFILRHLVVAFTVLQLCCIISDLNLSKESKEEAITSWSERYQLVLHIARRVQVRLA